jgi:hypothetical protein
MSNAATTTEQQKKASEALKKRQDELRKQHELFRSNPAKLAEAIAQQIRMDNHPNEDPSEYDNGAMHWYQEAWGNVKARVGSFTKLSKPVMNMYDNRTLSPEDHHFFEVSCPTTGCIAGWADSLAGYNLVFKKVIDWQDREYYAGNDSSKTDEQIVLDYYYDEGEVINVEYCYDPEKKQVRDISAVAEELLGLDYDQKSWLFDANRTKDEVLWALDEMAAERDWHGDNYGKDDEDVDEDQDDYEEVDS